MKLLPNGTHYQIHTVHNVPHPDIFTEAWTTILTYVTLLFLWKAWESNTFLINTLPHSILYGFVTISALKGILNHDILSFVSKTIDLSNVFETVKSYPCQEYDIQVALNMKLHYLMFVHCKNMKKSVLPQ